MEQSTSVVFSTTFAAASRTATATVPKALVLLDAHSTWFPQDATSPPSLRTKIWSAFSGFVRLLHDSANYEPRIRVLAVDAREDGVRPHLTVLADTISIQDPRALKTAMTRLQGALDARQLPTVAVVQYAHALLQEVGMAVNFTGESDALKPTLSVFTAPPVADALRTAAVVASPAFTVHVYVPSSLPPTVLTTTLSDILASVLRLDFTLTLPPVDGQSSQCAIEMTAQPRFMEKELSTTSPAHLHCVHIVTIDSIREDTTSGTPLVTWGTCASDALIFRLRATRAALLCVERQAYEPTGIPTFVMLPALAQRCPELALLRKIASHSHILPLPQHTPNNRRSCQSKDHIAQMADIFVRNSQLERLNSHILFKTAPTELPARERTVRKVRFDVDQT